MIQNQRTQDLWLTRFYFFLFIGGAGFLRPFLNLFYNRQGLTGEQIGLLATIASAISLVMAPISSMISGQTEHPQRVLQIGLLSSGALMLALSQQSAFLWFAILVMTDSILASGVWPISAAVAVKKTRKEDRAGYGSVRLWGSLGWAIIASLAGWLIEKTGIFSAFVGYSLTMVLAALLLERIRKKAILLQKEKKEKSFPWKGFKSLLEDRALLGFAIAVVLNRFSLLGIRQFEVLFMDRLGAPESMIGLASTIGAAVEIPVMLWADTLIKRFNSTWVLRISFGLYAFRTGLIAVFPTTSTIMISRAIGGISFAFYAVAMVVFIAERTPEKQNATLQALYIVSLPRMVAILGAPLMGYVYDTQGAYIFYPVGAIGIFLSFLVFLATVSGQRS